MRHHRGGARDLVAKAWLHGRRAGDVRRQRHRPLQGCAEDHRDETCRESLPQHRVRRRDREGQNRDRTHGLRASSRAQPGSRAARTNPRHTSDRFRPDRRVVGSPSERECSRQPTHPPASSARISRACGAAPRRSRPRNARLRVPARRSSPRRLGASPLRSRTA